MEWLGTVWLHLKATSQCFDASDAMYEGPSQAKVELLPHYIEVVQGLQRLVVQGLTQTLEYHLMKVQGFS